MSYRAYHPFFTRKTTISEKNSFIRPFFYSVHTFKRIRQHYFSKYWGGPMHGPSPTSNFGGDRPTQSPLGLRPCHHDTTALCHLSVVTISIFLAACFPQICMANQRFSNQRSTTSNQQLSIFSVPFYLALGIFSNLLFYRRRICFMSNVM